MTDVLIPLAGTAIGSLLGSGLAGGSGRKDRLQTIAAAEERRAAQEKALITQEQTASAAQTETNIANARMLKFNRGASKLLTFGGTGEAGVAGVPEKSTLG